MLKQQRVQDVSVPSFFYGTAWKEERTASLTGQALAAGFRAIDTANQRRHYIEEAVGEAVAATIGKGLLTRADLFLQTKFTFRSGQDERLPYDARAGVAAQVQQSFESSLTHLQTTYVDSLVLHGPSTHRGLDEDDWEAWRAMEALQAEGKARLIGVSNVSRDQLRALVTGSEVTPAFVQNRCFARTGWDRAVRVMCAEKGIAYQAFSLLTANVHELQLPAVTAIVAKSGRTLAQVLFRFALQAGMIPLTGTTSEAHMRENLAAYDFELHEDQVAAIERCAS